MTLRASDLPCHAIAIAAPAGRDARVILQTLASNGVNCRIVSPPELLAGIREGTLAGAILAEEALATFNRAALERAIADQPPWSDFPLVVLTFRGAPPAAGSSAIERLGNVSLLERPLHSSALYSAARAILRARSRQREIEQFLRQRDEAHANLEALNDLRDLFERAPSIIAVSFGPEHRFATANEAFRRLVGRKLIGRTVREALPELVEQGVVETIDRVYASGEPVAHRELLLRLRGSGGKMHARYLNLVFQPILGRSGEVKGIFAQGVDVTSQRRAQERVQLLQNELIQMSRLSAMGAMASTLSHELNQPLMAIASYLRAGTRLLEQGGPAGLEKVEIAMRQAETRA